MAANSSAQTVSTAVVEAVAAREGIEPLDVSEPLFKAIDPTGLNAVCDAPTAHVTFEYHGYLVSIDSDNKINLTEVAGY